MIENKQVKFEINGVLIEGTTYLIPPNPEYGYNCGFSIFVPLGCDKDTTLIMSSCNTGNNVPIHLAEANEIARKSTYERPNLGMWFGSDLNMPVMIPLIPRVVGYYTQALGSRVLHNDVSLLIEDQDRRSNDEKLSEEEIYQIQEQCRDIPTQVANMIKSAQLFLSTIGINVDDKVIAEGYSAGSKFANCFTALHPELIKACVCGGNSGLGILPLTDINGEELKYPLGVADIPNFDSNTFCSIPQLYYLGMEDNNDPAMAKIEVKEDHVEKIVPYYKENYTQHEIEQIHSLLGSNTQARFDTNETLYTSLGVNATFKRFSGSHNTVLQNPEAYEYIKTFIGDVLAKEKQSQNIL